MPLGQRKSSILLVDDDEAFTAVVKTDLLNAGYDVHVANSFQTALEALESDRPIDLLMTDLVMPHQVNGIALSRMARMRRKDLRIIYITGYDIPAGVDEQAIGPILRKPLASAVMMAEIDRALSEP